MPKIYKHISKRLAKKRLTYRWKKLLFYASGEITEGAIIHTCKGYNEIIVSIEENFSKWKLKRGWYLTDLDIQTDSGNNCSLSNCCTFPPLSNKEVLEYFQYRVDHPSDWGSFGAQDDALLEAVKRGENPFDENGCVKEEYKIT